MTGFAVGRQNTIVIKATCGARRKVRFETPRMKIYVPISMR